MSDHVTLNERFVRAFVAEGSGVPRQRVIPANSAGPALRTVDGDGVSQPFATVLLLHDAPLGHVMGRDLDEGARRFHWVQRRAEYSVQFFSKPSQGSRQVGAVEHAARFCLWAGSSAGIAEANGANWDDDDRMRLVLPLEYSRVPDEIHDDAWEERALVEMRADYVSSFVSDDVSIMDFDMDICHV